MKSLLAALALLVAGPAFAQAKPAAISPAAQQAAAALVAQLGIKPQLQAQMSNTVNQMRSGVVIRAMLAQQPGFVPAYQANKAKFDPVLAKAGAIQADIAQGVINQNLNAVVADAATAYARQFTLAELNGLIAFYRSPLGQALQKKQPLVANQIAQSSATRIGQKIDAAMQANQQKLRAALAPLNSQPAAAK
ncbi:DUF2059 domain-containing protein [Sandarakinorhabdus rubra]|uniref:DUF2059 domain-containing protein n=1 Tax=Sandarakinorhabdus rubra TaxID=2672568 RepID=UPI0013D95CC7|nr:DUF2059 domain-containing protein [Sandarakinorhabdus rubra]